MMLERIRGMGQGLTAMVASYPRRACVIRSQRSAQRRAYTHWRERRTGGPADPGRPVSVKVRVGEVAEEAQPGDVLSVSLVRTDRPSSAGGPAAPLDHIPT